MMRFESFLGLQPRHFAASILCTGLFVAAGCGEADVVQNPVPVKGVVVFRGKPLAKAKVTFYAKGARMPASGDTNDAGEFELSMFKKGDGALPGENTVTVVLNQTGATGSPILDPADVLKKDGGKDLPTKGEYKKADRGGIQIPKEYSNASGSPLKWTVKPEGDPSVKLELK